MHLVLDHVAKLEHVGYTNSSQLVELLAGGAVIELRGAVTGQTCLVGPLTEIIQCGTVENGSGELHAQLLAGSTQHGLEDLTDVHA